jgi:hypothetical protein
MKNQRLLLFAVFVQLVVLLFIAARPSQETLEKISVREFELLDESGKKRVSIRTEPDGAVVFRMMDDKGTIRVKLGADENGSGLVLLDDSTNPGLHALAKKNGTSLTLTDKNGKKRSY